MKTRRYSSENAREGMRRRDFLAWISAWIVVPSMPELCRAAGPDRGSQPVTVGGAQSLAVGYLDGSDAWNDPLALPLAGARVVPARALAGGDVDLALGVARLTVHGLYPQQLEAGLFDRADLSVFFPSPELDRPEDHLRYFAWSYSGSPVLNLGAANRFDVPVGVDGSLPLLVETVAGGQLSPAIDPSATVSRFANFTVDHDALRPKLRRGSYLLALSGDPWVDEATLPGPDAPVAPELASLVVTVADGLAEGGGEGGGSGDDTGEPPGPDPDGWCEPAGADRFLAGQDVGGTRTESACRSLSAAEYRVLDAGDVTFDSPSISLGDGFEVRGTFRARNPTS